MFLRVSVCNEVVVAGVCNLGGGSKFMRRDMVRLKYSAMNWCSACSVCVFKEHHLPRK
jgi:hypothetical protein